MRLMNHSHNFTVAMRKLVTMLWFFDLTQHEEHAPFINGITCITGPGLA